jgi:integrase
MKGHIRKRGRSSWALVFDLGRDAEGKRRQKWQTVQGTRKQAEAELARLLTEFNTGGYVEPTKMTLSVYLGRWLDDYATAAVSAKTLERYRSIIDGHVKPALGHVELTKLRPLQIQGFYSDCLRTGRKDGTGGLSARTVWHFHRVLHNALGQAVKWQMLARNPVDAVVAPVPEEKEIMVLDEERTTELLSRLEGSRLYLPVIIALSTGLRRGELLALRWQDIDLDDATMSVAQSVEQTKAGLRFKPPKTRAGRRRVALPIFLIDVLRQHRTKQLEDRLRLGSAWLDNDLVLPLTDGSAWPPDTFSTLFATFIRRSGIRHLRFHDLRHSHATELLRRGVHPKIVSERLGHANIGITLDTYSHVLPDMQEDAARQIDEALRATIRPI